MVRTLGDRIKHLVGTRWVVPSQTDPAGMYLVDVDSSNASCSCLDHTDRGSVCKHQLAVEIVRTKVTLPDGSTLEAERTRVSYKQNWTAYVRAQTEEKTRVQQLLRGLCDGIAQPEQESGRTRLLLSDVVYAGVMKIYTTMSSRRAMSDIKACGERGLLAKVPSAPSVNRYWERDDLTPLLTALVHESAAPLCAIETKFATDSTGFSTNTYQSWRETRWGDADEKLKRIQRWIKLHAQVGVDTNVIVSVAVTESNVSDFEMLTPLLTSSVERGFKVKQLSADKAYLGKETLEAIEAVGGVPLIPMKVNSTVTTKHCAAWKRLYHLYSANQVEFSKAYNVRQNVEATFSSIKRLLNGFVRAKSLAAQKNEVLGKCIAYNLTRLVHSIHELKIDPSFWSQLEVA